MDVNGVDVSNMDVNTELRKNNVEKEDLVLGTTMLKMLWMKKGTWMRGSLFWKMMRLKKTIWIRGSLCWKMLWLKKTIWMWEKLHVFATLRGRILCGFVACLSSFTLHLVYT